MNKIFDFFRLIYYFPHSVKREYDRWRFERGWGGVFQSVTSDPKAVEYLYRYCTGNALPTFVIKAPKWRLTPYLHRLFDFGAKMTTFIMRR